MSATPSNTSSDPRPPSSPVDSGATTVKYPLQTRLGRLGILFVLFQLGWTTTNNAAGNLLQAYAGEVAPKDTVAFYSMSSAVGAVLAAIAIIFAGGLSDRTRTRFGRRVPWIISGSTVAALALFSMSLTTNPVLVVAGWAIYQMALNAMVAAGLALTPDYLAKEIYGRGSGLKGLGVLLGSVTGGILTSVFIATPERGLMVVPWIMLVASILVAALLPRRSSVDEPRSEGGLLGFLRFLIPPKDGQFWLVFSGRFMFILGLYMVILYQFFIARDFLSLSTQEAGNLIALGSVVLAFSAGIATVVAGPLSDKVGRKPFVIGGPLLTIVALIPIWLAHESWAFVAFFAIGGLAYGSYLSVDAALMTDILPDKERAAKDLAILNASNTLPAVFAPAMSGTLLSLGGYPLVFSGVSVVCAAAGIVIFWVRRVH